MHTHIDFILNSRLIIEFFIIIIILFFLLLYLSSQPTQSCWPPSLDSQYTYTTDIELQPDWQAAYQACVSVCIDSRLT